MNVEKIKSEQRSVKDTYISAKKFTNVEEKRVSFSFADFKTYSVSIDNFNNYYLNIESSRNAVADFFSIISSISNLEYKELFSPQSKREYHLNKLTDENVISRIDNVLVNGYGFPQAKVDEFEQLYFEFQISDGKRVICYIVDNVIYPLFIDCNHMICIESSRNPKAKELYKIESSFARQGERELQVDEKEIKEILKMLVDEFSLNKNYTTEDIIDIIKDLII